MFHFTSTTDYTLSDEKINNTFDTLRELFNSNLKLEDYSEYKSVVGIFEILNEKDNSPEKKVIRRKTKQIELYINVPYNKFLLADEKEAVNILIREFKRALERFNVEKYINTLQLIADLNQLILR